MEWGLERVPTPNQFRYKISIPNASCPVYLVGIIVKIGVFMCLLIKINLSIYLKLEYCMDFSPKKGNFGLTFRSQLVKVVIFVEFADDPRLSKGNEMVEEGASTKHEGDRISARSCRFFIKRRQQACDCGFLLSWLWRLQGPSPKGIICSKFTIVSIAKHSSLLDNS